MEFVNNWIIKNYILYLYSRLGKIIKVTKSFDIIIKFFYNTREQKEREQR